MIEGNNFLNNLFGLLSGIEGYGIITDNGTTRQFTVKNGKINEVIDEKPATETTEPKAKVEQPSKPNTAFKREQDAEYQHHEAHVKDLGIRLKDTRCELNATKQKLDAANQKIEELTEKINLLKRTASVFQDILDA